MFDGNGDVIGLLIDNSIARTPRFMSHTGFVFGVEILYGYLQRGNLYYESSICSGFPRLANFQPEVWGVGGTVIPGLVFRALDLQSTPPYTAYTYYIPHNVIPETIPSYILGSDGVCRSNTSGSDVVRILDNDPAITGVPSFEFPLPITYGLIQ